MREMLLILLAAVSGSTFAAECIKLPTVTSFPFDKLEGQWFQQLVKVLQAGAIADSTPTCFWVFWDIINDPVQTINSIGHLPIKPDIKCSAIFQHSELSEGILDSKVDFGGVLLEGTEGVFAYVPDELIVLHSCETLVGDDSKVTEYITVFTRELIMSEETESKVMAALKDIQCFGGPAPEDYARTPPAVCTML